MTDEEIRSEGFTKFESMVIRNIDANTKAIKELSEQVSNLTVSQAEIRIKSSLWGAFSAALVTLGTFLFRYLIPLTK